MTDIPYYERVEYSHLHDFGQKSERTRFLEKIKKLEEAADVKAKLGTVEEVHRPVEKPPGWKPVKLPKRIERGPTSVLNAMASVVGPDPTAAAYQYHDDPYLIPFNSADKEDFLLAKDSGRQAARFILNRHPELFEKNLIDMEPKIKRYMPRATVTQKNANIELLENYIHCSNVLQATETYKFLEEKGQTDGIDISLKQSLLELICYHNELAEMDEDSFRELWGWASVGTNDAHEGTGFAEQLSLEITTNEDADQKAKMKAKVALACGHSRHEKVGNVSTKHRYVMDVYDEVGDAVADLNFYNHVILSIANSHRTYPDVDEAFEKVKGILAKMKEKRVRPNAQTLCNILKMISNQTGEEGNDKHRCVSLARSVMSEFKKLGVEPSLGCYHFYALVELQQSRNEREGREVVYIDIMDALEKNLDQLKPVIKEDFLFFQKAMMEISGVFNKTEASKRSQKGQQLPVEQAYRLHKLAVTGGKGGDMLLGDRNSANAYYKEFIMKLLKSAPLDEAMDLWCKIVPHIHSPYAQEYRRAFSLIPTQNGWKHLPRVWSDFYASEFNRQGWERTLESFNIILEGFTSWEMLDASVRSTEEDHNMFQNFISIVTQMCDVFFDKVQLQERFQRRGQEPSRHNNVEWSGQNTIKFINLALKIASNKVLSHGEYVVANFEIQCELIRLVKEHDLELSGAIEPTTLANCLDNCMEALNTQEAVNIVQYAAENQLKCAMPLALTLVNSKDIQLESAHKVLINSLFHYETKWVPV